MNSQQYAILVLLTSQISPALGLVSLVILTSFNWSSGINSMTTITTTNTNTTTTTNNKTVNNIKIKNKIKMLVCGESL